MESALLVNVVQLDAKVDARDSANTHQLDVWCFYEVSRTFNPAVGLGTSISDVQLPPPELRKVAHIPPTENVNITTQIRPDTRKFHLVGLTLRSYPRTIFCLLTTFEHAHYISPHELVASSMAGKSTRKSQKQHSPSLDINPTQTIHL